MCISFKDIITHIHTLVEYPTLPEMIGDLSNRPLEYQCVFLQTGNAETHKTTMD